MDLCGANKSDGETCRNSAGAGTAHPGYGKCKWHFGGTSAHAIHAARLEAYDALESLPVFGDLVDIDPADALLMMVQRSTSMVSWLEAKLQTIDLVVTNTAGTSMLHPFIKLHAEERERLARFSKLVLDAGVEERQVRVTERTGMAVADLIKSVLGDLELSDEQIARAPALIQTRLLELAAG